MQYIPPNEEQTVKSLTSDVTTKSQRILSAMNHYTEVSGKKLSWNRLATMLNKTPSAPTSWKNNKVSDDTLKEIATLTGVSYSWLLSGAGLMLSPDFNHENSVNSPEIDFKFHEIGVLFVNWLKTINEATDIQEETLFLTEHLKIQPDQIKQNKIIKLQSSAIQKQQKAQNIYASLLSKSKVLF